MYQKRMGGSDDGSGTGQAANVANDPEDGSAAEGIEVTVAEAAAETTTTGEKASALEMTAISEENAPTGDGSVSDQDADGAPESGGAPRKGGALSSPDQTTADLAHDAEAATPQSTAAPLALLPAAAAANGGDDRNLLSAAAAPSPARAPATGASNGATCPLPSDSQARDDLKASGRLTNGVIRQPETAVTEAQPGHQKDAAPGGSSEKGEKRSKGGRGRQTPGRAGNESKATQENSGSARSKDDDAPKKVVAHKTEGGVEELLDSTVSHTVDCLVYIRWYVCRDSDPEA